MIKLEGQFGHYLFDPGNEDTVIKAGGKFGNTYAGVRDNDRAPVLIKELNPLLLHHPAAVVQFKFEADACFNHPNIRQTLEFITTASGHFLVQEYVHGIDAGTFFRQNKVFRKDMQFAVLCILTLLDALEYIHKKNTIHCDIKPTNILFGEPLFEKSNDKKLNIRLIDFGNARTPLAEFLTTIRPFSLCYAPPEQMLHFYDLVGPSSDLFSLAITFYELITLQPAFDPQHPEMLMHLQLNQELKPHPAIPEELFSIFKKATAREIFRLPPRMISREEQYELVKKGIARRYTDAACMRADLLTYVASIPRVKKASFFGSLFQGNNFF